MVRTGIGVAAVAAAALFSGMFIQAARAGDGATSGYGGGFIELLMTGRDPGAARAYRPAPVAPDGRALPRRLSSGDPYGDPDGSSQRRVAGLAQPGFAPDEPAAIGRAPDPRYLRQEVAYEGGERPGTIVIDTPAKFLYLVQPGGRALRYGIGVGRPGFAWAGMKTVSRKAEWPDWTPPPEMLRRRPDLPAHMEGGPANPLGARALYLGSSLYRIHGTNEPHTIGQSVSSGCIRMTNEDVTDLYGRVPVGTRVLVL